jgi:HTH-type transcriptional repressor of NAD biosynthesis genes
MEKRFNCGLVLGKFMPVHNGHLHLIDTAIEQCEMVYVMVCSLESEPINGKLRWSWLQMIYQGYKNVKIINCEDENPQKPEECSSTDEFYHQYWLPSVYNRIDYLDAVFTSEEYGDEFAEYLEVEHVLVDLERKKYPVSGTLVRNDAFAMWDFIPDVVKSFFTKRIVVVGPESTGKSTLVKNLATHYTSAYVAEYGRTYIETVKPSMQLEIDDYYEIAGQHNDILLETHMNIESKYLFVDTDAITTKLFGEMYIDGFKDPRIDRIIDHQWFDLYLLMDIDVPWVDDGTRDFPNDRARHFNKIKAELDRLGKNYVIINGDYEERFEKVKKEIEKLG